MLEPARERASEAAAARQPARTHPIRDYALRPRATRWFDSDASSAAQLIEQLIPLKEGTFNLYQLPRQKLEVDSISWRFNFARNINNLTLDFLE
jgi:hypothetical protein